MRGDLTGASAGDTGGGGSCPKIPRPFPSPLQGEGQDGGREVLMPQLTKIKPLTSDNVRAAIWQALQLDAQPPSPPSPFQGEGA
jgi:hypothetical protein